MSQKNNKSVSKLVTTGMLTALAVVFMLLVRFSILPGAKFLEYDMGDIPVIFASLFVGSPASIFALFVVSLVQSLTVSSASSWQGFIMHMLSTGAYILVLKLITYKKISIKRLIFAVISATAALTLIMIPLNLIFTPMYLNTTVEAVAQLLLPAIIPFNLLKGVINSIITVIMYRPLKDILSKSKLLPDYKQ